MKRVVVGSAWVLLNAIVLNEEAIAQVVPDNTVGTIVNLTGTAYGINNGTRSGNNLFHSFNQFSIPTNGSAIFNNATDVQNIFSRVTGSQLSNIDGILKTQGNANLFLMNSNGIVFGPNAQLQLGGSFLGTTASSIKFSDGIEFNTANATPALLSVNVPIGLQMGQSSGPITVQGVGHTLFRPTLFSPAPVNTNPSTLTVNRGRTLTLVGNTISLEGGNLKAPSGIVEIASLSAGQVDVHASRSGWRLGNINAAQWEDISLSRASLVDVSGSPGGTIQLLGRDITLQDSSTLLNQNQGIQNADRISVRAAGTLTIQKSLPNRDPSLITSETFGSGQGAEVTVVAKTIKLFEGGAIAAVAYLGGGRGGNILVNATDSIIASGFSPVDPSRVSGIITSTLFGGGSSGNNTITTQQLRVYGGSSISSTVFGGSAGGNLEVSADTIDLMGENIIIGTGSTLTNTTFSGGDAGKLLVKTRQILIRDGGAISSSTLGSGAAGNLTIQASESIQVSGRGRSGQESRIAASGETLPLIFQQIFRLPSVPTGDSGNLAIDSPLVQVQDGGSIRVDNTGTGTAGKLSVTANSLQLDRGSAITASTQSGQGGDIKLSVQESIFLRRGSRINATAAGIGNGGNIEINSPIIVGLENSDIITNAIQGTGGNIKINTQGLFGLQYRTALTPDNDITASSEFGINGNVQVNTIGINPANSLNELPVDIIDSSRQIADRCGNAKNSSFIATGRGGIPQDPMRRRSSDRPWTDTRPLTPTRSTLIQPTGSAQPLIEASAIQVDESGAIVLGTSSTNVLMDAKPTVLPSAVTCGMGQSHSIFQ